MDTVAMILVDFIRHKKPREVFKLAGFGTSWVFLVLVFGGGGD